MWEIYDDLIDSIPDDLTVLECMLGVSWTAVKSENGIGVAKTIKGGKKGLEIGEISGLKLKELAKYAKSWNMLEASLGQAAINSAFNTAPQCADSPGLTLNKEHEHGKNNAFNLLSEDLVNKKVAVIGHFPEVEKLHDICNLSVLERDPWAGDYPDSACEYLLPEQDFVFITGTAFTNKTMPRLIELSRKARIILVGPSVPISEVLFKYGVYIIAGFIVTDEKLIWKAVQEGKKMNIFKHGGEMICIRR
ncbi:hypothetical protein SAMN02745691_00938 [Parasporobacterium paucivorans DSM 15970]|uniref:Heavy-metal chelation n=1 Tax=Parasporobacterium paucivorans DSM 15970 TaxID=1122934 RepID=A0A1M6EKV0_9FIRM|nr:hypothetical protein SAMN02745691_00938 [Parasporobacterium paucivorans DSM 15970]